MDFPTHLYIDGALVKGTGQRDIVNPATEEVLVTVSTAGFDDVDRACRLPTLLFRMGINIGCYASDVDATPA